MVRSCVLTVMAMTAEIERCIEAEYKRLVGVVSLVTGSVALAEEAVQEAFARAWERAQRGQDFDHLAGWVATVALNQARSGRRRLTTERARWPVSLLGSLRSPSPAWRQ